MKSNHKLLKALAAPLLTAFLASTANAALFDYFANLDGPSESPPNASPATGFAEVNYDSTLHLLQVEVTFSGLLGPTTASHIHTATAVPGVSTAGVATTTPYFAGFPIGVTSGSYSNTLDLTLASSHNPTFVSNNGGTTASAEAALAAGIAAGEAYLNIHSQVFPSGEIRGFLLPVPEPSSLALIGFGGAALAWVAKRRQRA